MKYSKLKSIINEEAHYLEECADYGGKHDSSFDLLYKLELFERKLVIKYDLRPSEFNKLEDVEVGEPLEFKKEIMAYKINLAKNIVL